MKDLLHLGDDGERRVISFRFLPNDRIIVVEAWACDDAPEQWERMATPFPDLDAALDYVRSTYA
jgi:hypothetical protein